MPSYIIKPVPDEDFYVVYSTIVDSPTWAGSRAELEEEYPDSQAERFERADKTGTSALWGNPPAYGWDDGDEIMVREGIIDASRPDHYSAYGLVKRADLRKLCESVRDDGYMHPSPGLIKWVTLSDEE